MAKFFFSAQLQSNEGKAVLSKLSHPLKRVSYSIAFSDIDGDVVTVGMFYHGTTSSNCKESQKSHTNDGSVVCFIEVIGTFEGVNTSSITLRY
jgi:hypothetical protein